MVVSKYTITFVYNIIYKAWPPDRKSGFNWYMFFILLIFLPCCNQPSPTGNTEDKLPAITQFSTSLEDEIKNLPDNQISWSTYWKMCWPAYPEAMEYEIQVSTSEGTSPKIKSHTNTCYRIQIATGINDKAQGMFNRDNQIKLQSGQLGYKVRAVVNSKQVSEWSATIWLADIKK